MTLPSALSDPQRASVLLLFLAVSLLLTAQWATGAGRRLASYLQYLWVFLLVFGVAELISFTAAVWILAGLCFLALREFFALVPLRVQDRWAMLGAYLSIPFMIAFVQIDWYGMFIVSIPVYGFLVIPALVALGGREAEGTVFSIGAIDFGLFLFVYCAGHIGYLARLSTWKGILLVLCVAAADVAAEAASGPAGRRRAWLLLPAAAAATLSLALALAPWAEIPIRHAAVLGLLIPALAWAARGTLAPIARDLRIEEGSPIPGRGGILSSLRSFLFAGPVVFHYVWFFLT